MKSKTRRVSRLIEGLPVVDATRDLAIQITPDDIKRSQKGNAGKCAAAVACQRQVKKEVRVFLTKTYIKEKKHWVRYQTPERISREIIAFDRGSAFVPGVYTINAPTGSDRLGAQRVGKVGPKESNGRPVKPHHVTKQVRSYKEQIA